MFLPKAQIPFPTKASPINRNNSIFLGSLYPFERASHLNEYYYPACRELQRDSIQSTSYPVPRKETQKLTKFQISNSLENALNTFGPSSRQYQTILGMLKECLRDIEHERQIQNNAQVVDAGMLSLAMGFLEIGK